MYYTYHDTGEVFKMFFPSIFSTVIPKYKLYIDSILLEDKEIIQKAIEKGTTSSETTNKLNNLYLEFVQEYNLYNIEKAQNVSPQLITDISDTEKYFSQATNYIIWGNNPGDMTFDTLNSFAKINDFISSPLIMIIIALFIPLIAKYGLKAILWLIKQTASNDKVALVVTAVGLGLILLISLLI